MRVKQARLHRPDASPAQKDGCQDDDGPKADLDEHDTDPQSAHPRAPMVDRRALTPYLGPIMATQETTKNYKVIAENRRARFDFAIEDDIECGIVLMGSEVKSLRTGQSNITESYASVEGGELWLTNAYIARYDPARQFGHEERRRRKLLVRGKELARLWNATSREGMTIVPLVMYFNDKGRVKLKIAIAKGKKLHDKRATEATRDWDRQKRRLLKEHS
jgi:SsrA-binding protein